MVFGEGILSLLGVELLNAVDLYLFSSKKIYKNGCFWRAKKHCVHKKTESLETC